MVKTLIILNPHAAGGLAGEQQAHIEATLYRTLGEQRLAVTQRPEEVIEHLHEAHAGGVQRVVSVGGDGTNHVLVNALADLRERYPDLPPMLYGMLPVGTGRDWARSAGIPLHSFDEAANWLAASQPRATDIGLALLDGHPEYFLNIASVGISGDVDRRVNSARLRRPWTFLAATVAAILTAPPPDVRVICDGEVWYEGRVLLVAVANGTTFGHGMRIAPHARIDDGVFDLVLVKDTGKLETLMALRRVYNGTHLSHRAVMYRRASEVHIESRQPESPMSLDLDGEHATAQHISFYVRPGLLTLLR